jgi:hypothetical protein
MFSIVRLILVAASTVFSLSACTAPGGDGTAATPGWTGRSVVVGSTSTIAGNAIATEQQQKWPIGRGR